MNTQVRASSPAQTGLTSMAEFAGRLCAGDGTLSRTLLLWSV